jgi:hypothetical protein
MVLDCSRNGCDGILCGRYSEEYGYICLSCYTELDQRIKKSIKFTEKDLNDFMDSEKVYTIDGSKINLNDYFKLLR